MVHFFSLWFKSQKNTDVSTQCIYSLVWSGWSFRQTHDGNTLADARPASKFSVCDFAIDAWLRSHVPTGKDQGQMSFLFKIESSTPDPSK